jgi:hypothetical protein
VLTTILFQKGITNAMSLISMISSNANSRVKSAIWMGKKDVTPGNVHALLLMLIASNIIQLQLVDNATPSDAKNLILLRNVNAVLTKQFASGIIFRRSCNVQCVSIASISLDVIDTSFESSAHPRSERLDAMMHIPPGLVLHRPQILGDHKSQS